MESENPTVKAKKQRSTDRLNPRSRSFAEKVAGGMDATSAYLEAGYNSSSRKNAQRASWRLGEKPAVAAYIQELREAAAAKSKAEATLTIEDKLAYLVRAIKTGAGSLTGQDELGKGSVRAYVQRKTGVPPVRIHLPQPSFAPPPDQPENQDFHASNDPHRIYELVNTLILMY